MDPDLWKKVDALLEAALAQPADEREAFVLEAAKDNDELRDEVLSLLKAQAQASKFMERSAMKVAAAALAQSSCAHRPRRPAPAPRAGKRSGRPGESDLRPTDP